MKEKTLTIKDLSLYIVDSVCIYKWGINDVDVIYTGDFKNVPPDVLAMKVEYIYPSCSGLIDIQVNAEPLL